MSISFTIRHLLLNTAWAVAVILPFVTVQPSFAQAPPRVAPTPPAAQTEPPIPRIDPKACAERLPTPPQTQGQRPPTNETLSEKLDRTEGVICPPLGIDPEIVEAPPGGGRTPVIPPPGSPGGDPTIRPK